MSFNAWLEGVRSQFSLGGRRTVRRKRIDQLQPSQVSSEALESRLLLTTTYINAGGPTLDGDPTFVEDDSFQNGVGRSFIRRNEIDLSGVEGDFPASVFQSHLWDRRGGSALQFDIPVTAGTEYQVDLLFSETWRGGFDVGARVFDVSLEGDVVLDDFDIFAEVGAETGLVKSFNITPTDNNIDIDFAHGASNNPSIAGIVVRQVGDDSPTNLPPTISDIPNQAIEQDTASGPLNFTVADPDGDVLTVTASSSNPALVADNAVVVSGSGENRSVTVTPVAGQSGTSSITLTVSDGQATAIDSYLITVNPVDPVDPVDPPPNPETLMLNAGAGAVADFESATAFHDLVRSVNPRRAPSIANVPASIPAAVFQSNIWSPRRLGDIEFDLPTEVGVEYQVDLLFAETWRGAFRNGVRQFDVSLDGQQVLNDFDIFANAGANTASVQSFTIMGDGNLDLDLSRVRNNPTISGVILTRIGDPPPPPTNVAPVLSAISDQTVEQGVELQFTAAATDADAGDTLTYSILTDGLPGSPTISSSLGSFSWIPPSAGEFQVTLQVSDGELMDTEVFTVTVTEPVEVNQAPIFAAIADQSVEEGVELQLTAVATDSNVGDTLTYSILTDGLQGSPTINPSSGSLSWTPLSAGDFQVTIQVSDGELTDTETFRVTVTEPAEVNLAPVLEEIADQSVNEGDQLQLTFVGTDPNVGDVLTYSLDSIDLPGNPQIDSATGVFTWTPPLSDGPGYSVTVRVTDAAGLFDTETALVFVDAVSTGNLPPTLDAIPSQTASVGQQLTFTATASDPNDDVLEFFLDPSAPAGAVINAATGVFTWTPSSSDVGPVSFPVFVTDGTVTVEQSVFVTVEGNTGSNTPPSFGPQNDLTVAATSTLTEAITASDSDPGDVLTYVLLTENLPGDPTVDPNTGVLTWTPPASAANTTFQIEIRATDLAGTSDVAMVNVRVAAASDGGGGGGGGGGGQNSAPVVQPIPNQTATVGTPLTFTVEATDADDDVLEYFLDPTGPFTASLTSAGVFTWTPSPGDVGTTTFPIFVSDGTVNVFRNVTIVISA